MQESFREQYEKLVDESPDISGVEWAVWMRNEGRRRSLHGSLLDSAILDHLEESI
jgi:hypothetical protein